MASPLRIGGLATGMDTDGMVKKLMDAESLRLNKYNASKQVKVWTQEAYNNTNKDIANFILDSKKELELTKTTSSGSLIGGTSDGFSWVKKGSSSNTGVADVTTSAVAVGGTHSLNVTSLASGITAASGEGVDETAFDNIKNGYSFSINGKSVTLGATDTLGTLASKITALGAGINASYDTNTKRFFMSTTKTGSSATLKIDDTNPAASSLFSNVLKLNVTANNSSGALVTEKLDVNAMRAVDSSGVPTKGYQGIDAVVDFDGATGIKYSSNQFNINGMSISIKGTGSSTIKVDTDIEGVYSKIKGFVDKYNEMIAKLGTKITEKKYRDYQPLTEEQKKAMDKDTITLWEDKAKSGLLKDDDRIAKILNNTRSEIYDSVYSDYSSTPGTKLTGYSMLTEIGITTGAYQEKGKLVIDESKLKSAITNNADGVMNLLFKTSSIAENDAASDPNGKGVQRKKESGIITRLYDDFTAGMKDIINKSGTGQNASLYRNVKANILIEFVTKSGSISNLDKDVLAIDKSISSEKDRLSAKEQSYYKKFASLESAMNNMNSQSNWLASQLGGK